MANMPIAETGQCEVAVAVAVDVVAVEAALVVVVEESGCWCEKMHPSSGMEAVDEEADAFTRVALVDIANHVSHLCLSHL